MATTATALLRPGDVLGGFRIDDVIGVGGMAIVYRAEQVSLGRPVALKVLSSKLTRDEVFRERFRREGTHAAALEHPNIVPVYDSGEENGLLYLAMRLVEGTNLAELIQTRGLTADQTIEILRPIASALDTAHAAGLIHRDVKPQNILITAHGHPYLADFGVAKGSNTSGLTATGGFVGSVNYASPEQIKGLTLTASSDVYALTAVLYQCLTAQVPYPRETDAGIMHAHLNEPPPTLSTVTGADSDLHTVLARGMAKDPGARYGHAGDLINAAGLSVSRMPNKMRKAVPAFPIQPSSEASSADPVAAAAGETGRGPSASLLGSPSPGAFTVADQRRAPAPEPEDRIVGSRRRWPLVAGIIGIAVAAIAGALLLSSSGGPHTTTISRGFIRLGYTKPWRQVSPKSDVDGLRFKDPINLAYAGASLTAGALTHGALIPGSLPPGLKVGSAKAQKMSVRLATTTAVRYDIAGVHRIPDTSLMIIPTALGDLGVLCSGTSSLALSACVKIAQTTRAIGVQVVPAGADPKLAKGLSKSLTISATARTHLIGLSSSRISTRVSAARHISAADTQTVRSLRGLSPEPRDRHAIALLTSVIAREASAFGSLAGAAAKKDHAGYETAVTAINRSGHQLRLALLTLRRMGFVHLPALQTLSLARFPISHHRSASTRSSSSTGANQASVPAAPQTSAAPESAPAPRAPEPAHVTPTPHHPKESSETVVSAPT